MRITRQLASLLLMITFSGIACAGEMTYTGTGTSFSTKVLLPLGNGGAAVKMDNTVVVTIAPAEYGFLFGECTGLGYISPEGKFSSTAYCNLREDEANSLDIRSERDGESGTGTIIGGTGRWKDASGTLQMKVKFAAGARGSFDYTMKVKTP